MYSLEKRNRTIRAMSSTLYHKSLDPIYKETDELVTVLWKAGFLNEEIAEFGGAASMMAATRFHNDRRRRQKALQELWVHSIGPSSTVDRGGICPSNPRGDKRRSNDHREPPDPVYLEDLLQTDRPGHHD